MSVRLAVLAVNLHAATTPSLPPGPARRGAGGPVEVRKPCWGGGGCPAACSVVLRLKGERHLERETREPVAK